MFITLPSGEKEFVYPELTPEERRALIEKSIDQFLKALIASEGENLLKVVLYGSVARHEENDDSDIDIFVLLKDYDLDKKSHVFDLAFDVSFELTGLRFPLSTFTIGYEEYMQVKRQALIYFVIEDEGVVLYDADA